MAEIDYNEKVKNHFFNPRNVGEIKDADGVGTVGNPVCGDVMTIFIKVKNTAFYPFSHDCPSLCM